MTVLESYLYGDPSESLDRKREQEKREAKRKARQRYHKHLRIASLVKAKMRGK